MSRFQPLVTPCRLAGQNTVQVHEAVLESGVRYFASFSSSHLLISQKACLSHRNIDVREFKSVCDVKTNCVGVIGRIQTVSAEEHYWPILNALETQTRWVNR